MVAWPSSVIAPEFFRVTFRQKLLPFDGQVQASYGSFAKVVSSPIGLIVLIVVSWAFFAHMFSGLRHFVLDAGAGYELRTNKRWASVTVAAPPVLTVLFWIYILAR